MLGSWHWRLTGRCGRLSFFAVVEMCEGRGRVAGGVALAGLYMVLGAGCARDAVSARRALNFAVWESAKCVCFQMANAAMAGSGVTRERAGEVVANEKV